ncbi:hypothetical protein LCGC14_2808290 [marine sediment metagenome]|uniref:Uncharacterized protein n=1 Tax=marine sediment metagenome TaxID=412755 RepID=A0A0F9AU55_9ZZZZ
MPLGPKHIIKKRRPVKPKDLQRRLGKFSMTRDVIIDSPALARKVLQGCIVVRAEHLWDGDIIEYIAIHPRFDPVPEGSIAPTYVISITVPGNILSWTKAKGIKWTSI